MVLASQASRQSPRNLMNSSQGRRNQRARMLLVGVLIGGSALAVWLAWSWFKPSEPAVEARSGSVGEQVPADTVPLAQGVPLTNTNDRQPRTAAVVGPGQPVEVIGAPSVAAAGAIQPAGAGNDARTTNATGIAANAAKTVSSADTAAQVPTTATSVPGNGAPTAPSVSAPAGSTELDAAITLADSNPLQSRAALTRLLEGSALSTSDRLRGYDAINRINGVLVFSNRVVAGDPYSAAYKVQGGDSLARIAKEQKLDCDWRLVQRINGIKSPNGLHVGQSVKLPRGVFHAEVRKSEYRLNIYMGEGPDRVMIASYPIGLGELNTTPTGAFVVRPKSKLIDPEWRNPRTGEHFAANDPKNPIGERWIGLKGVEPHNKGFEGYGIHGTIDEDSIGQQRSMGCVRMHANDVELVYEMLTEPNSTIVIAP